MRVNMEQIVVDFALQPRTGLKRATVAEFADRMLSGDKFPPVLLFRINEKLHLVDGFHRYYAAQRIQSLDIEAQIQENATYREALLVSIDSNRNHGIRFSNADKRKAVFRLLKDQEWSGWSDNKIADFCGVSQPFVSNLRAELQGDKMAEQKEKTQKESRGANKSRDLEAENKKLRKQIERLKAELEKSKVEIHNLRIDLMKERRKT